MSKYLKLELESLNLLDTGNIKSETDNLAFQVMRFIAVSSGVAAVVWVTDLTKIIAKNQEWQNMDDQDLLKQLAELAAKRLRFEQLDNYSMYLQHMIDKSGLTFGTFSTVNNENQRYVNECLKRISKLIEADKAFSANLELSVYFKARFAFELYKYMVEHKEETYDTSKGALSKVFLQNMNSITAMVGECQVRVNHQYSLYQNLLDQIEKTSSESLAKFLSANPDIDLSWIDSKGENCLFTAARRNDPKIMKILLQVVGADDLNIQNHKGDNLLLSSCSYDSSEVAVELISDERVDITSLFDGGSNILFEAVSRDMVDVIIKLLSHKDVSKIINNIVKHGNVSEPPLARAGLKLYLGNQKYLEIILKMLASGADPLAKVHEKGILVLTCFCDAIDARKLDEILSGMAQGVSLDSKVSGVILGCLIEKAAELKKTSEFDKYHREVALIKYLISHKSFKIDFANETSNLLHHAIFHGMAEVAESMILQDTAGNKIGEIDLFAQIYSGFNIMFLLVQRLELSTDETEKEIIKKKIFPLLKAQPEKDGLRVVDMKNSDGTTAMHWVAQAGSAELCKDLLKMELFSTSISDNNGRTPIYFAIQRAHLDIFNLLYENGNSDMLFLYALEILSSFKSLLSKSEKVENLTKIVEKIYDSSNFTPTSSGLILAAKCNLTEICKDLIIKHKISLEKIVNDEGANPLHYACANGNLELVKFFLEYPEFSDKLHAEITSGTSAGNNVMHFAAESKNKALVEFLHKQKVDINAENKKQETPLFFAVRRGDEVIFKYLYDNGAKIEHKSQNNITAIDYAFECGTHDIVYLVFSPKDNNGLGYDINSLTHCSEYPLISATISSERNLRFLENLIVKGANPFVHSPKSARTALHELVVEVCKLSAIMSKSKAEDDKENKSIIEDSKKIIKMLAEIVDDEGVKLVDYKDTKSCRNPILEVAGWYGDLDMLKFLIECEADLNIEVKAPGITNGLNAIGLALYYDKKEVVKYLLDHPGIELFAKDKVENNLLHIAARNGAFDMIDEIYKKHPIAFFKLCDQTNIEGENFIHLVVDFSEYSFDKKAKFVKKFFDIIDAHDHKLLETIKTQEAGTFRVSFEDYMSTNRNFSSAYDSVCNARKKIEADKKRLGIDVLEHRMDNLEHKVDDILGLLATRGYHQSTHEEKDLLGQNNHSFDNFDLHDS